MPRQSELRTPLLFWNSRPFEWGVLLLVLALLLGMFDRHYLNLQSQAEFAGIQSALGSMRTALLLDFLQRASNGAAPVASEDVPANPFPLLQTPVHNYAGEIAMADAARAPPGSWMYDPHCPCIGYRPMYPDAVDNQKDLVVLWFNLRTSNGVTQIKPVKDYQWDGQSVY